ncbi:DNA polymerase I [Oenococcus oeni]|uniref:DNA polymerase I n=2 Tax=Oenococcus oeni TaxID=1247 RepID=A0AAJ2P2F4_OENOE|nr:DNA polymerase I [Oenococcus oeni]MDV7715733.1 DNA polymerase I [Oenococcus oeni]SYW10074.1 DNA polymerase I [Oenococcus oeni]
MPRVGHFCLSLKTTVKIKAMTKTLLLIDGNSLAFRAFYAMYNQLDRMVAHTGLHTNALVAFNNFFDQVVEKMNPDYALVAWDAGKGATTFRAKIFDDYKGDRQTTPPELSEQFPYLRKMVDLHGIHSYELPGFEADDIIGTYSKLAEKAGLKTTIITGDRDLTQLVTDNVSVNVTKKGVTELDRYTPKFLAEKWGGITPSQVIEMKSLTGDTSDHYPGVTKVGEKTAIKLLNEFGSLDGIYQHIDSMKTSKLKENLLNDKESAYRAHELATIRTDAPVELEMKELINQPINFQELIPFYEELDFKVQLAKIHSMQKAGMVGQDQEEEKNVQVTELKAANLDHLLEIKNYLTVYFQTDSDNYHTAKISAFVVGNENDGYFASRDLELLNSSVVRKLFKGDLPKYVFNAKELIVLLNRLGLQINNLDFDFLLVSYLLDTTDNDNQLATLANRFNVFLESDAEVYGSGVKFKIPENNETLFSHMANKASTISKLHDPSMEKLSDHQQAELYRQIELPLSKVLASMEINGIKLDQAELKKLGQEFDQRIFELEKQIYEEAGQEFNINSPKQLADLLFVHMKIPPIKKTKTGYSTAANVLEELAEKYPFVGLILQYRQLAKLNSTYVKGLLEVVNPDDSKIHTRYLQTLTQTGRLSSVDPNMQNIPDRDEEGKRIRKAFVPSHEGWEIFGSDYSQIELRVLAHVTGDENLKKAFESGEDIHAATARSIFGLSADQKITFDQRRRAKAVNFGIVYGISDFGLAQRLGISRIEGKEIIQTYFHEFPKVKNWIDSIIALAHKQGYVETIAQRRRYLPDIHSKNFNLRSFAERTATNTPIQGSAADIIKIAMIKMQQALDNNHLKAKMLLQVHDELIFEAPKQEIDILEELVPKVMDSAVKLNVPLRVEAHHGVNWYDEK